MVPGGMLFALSTGHEIGLAVAGCIFIGFALLSSFVFPRLNPDFPTRQGLRWYLPLSFVIFAGMLGSVLYFGQEKKTAEAAGSPPAATTPAGQGGKYSGGDAAAGKTVFTTAGCVACHTFKPAGSTGKVGPPLDALAQDAAQAKQPVQDFAASAIIHPPPAYVPKGYPTNAMPTTFGQSLTQKQIADLVAFLTSGS
jgi:cytochrome c2